MGEQVAARAIKKKYFRRNRRRREKFNIDTGKGEQQLTDANPISREVLL